MRKKPVIIAGAGLAGLTAAINLAREGHRVKVYEKSPQVGQHSKETVQLLPNWFFGEDVIEELEKCNIKINWLRKIEQIEIYLKNQKIVFSGQKTPLGYTVLRGGENSFERELARQAESLGVEIVTNHQKEVEADIVATGLSRILTVGYGRVYKGRFNPNRTKVLFNPDFSPSVGYCYFFPHNKNIATVKISKKVQDEGVDLKENLKRFQKEYLAGQVKEENFLYEFATKRSFGIPQSAISPEGSFLVGEAAGFQDELFRFGMRYAIISGYLAARAIIDNSNYDELWKKRFLGEFKKTARVRRIFCNFKEKGLGKLPEDLELYIEIEKFKSIWLSPLFDLFLVFHPLYQNLLSNRFALKGALKLLSIFNLFSKKEELDFLL